MEQRKKIEVNEKEEERRRVHFFNRRGLWQSNDW